MLRPRPRDCCLRGPGFPPSLPRPCKPRQRTNSSPRAPGGEPSSVSKEIADAHNLLPPFLPAHTAVPGRALKFKSEPAPASPPPARSPNLRLAISSWGERQTDLGKVINFQFYFKIYQMGDFIGAINMSRAMLVCDGRCPLLGASLPV